MAKKSSRVRTVRVEVPGARSVRVNLDNMNMKKNFKVVGFHAWDSSGGSTGGNLFSLSTVAKSGAAGS